MDSGKETVLNSFDDLEKWWSKHKDESTWAFRGSRREAWKLETSLERYCKTIGRNLCDAVEIEHVLIREFRRRYHQYDIHPPRPEDDMGWMSIMQHHGAPTRLLDWTYSIYVAAYFALEHGCCPDDRGSAVWAIDTEWTKIRIGELFRNDQDKRKYLLEEINEKDVSVFRTIFINEGSARFVFQVNPFHLPQRSTLQKSVFMCPGDVGASFEDNLKAHPEWQNHVHKLVIPKALRREYLQRFHEMNISQATLFPGIDGFSKSLGVYHPGIQWG